MRSSFKVGSIAGIAIGVHYTWILGFALFAYILSAGLFPVLLHPNQTGTTATDWILGVSATLLLFVSVLLHELAHSLIAKSRGMGVSSITLFIFGGVSNLEDEPKKASTEFIMAFVGPLTSLVLGGVLWAVGLPLGLSGASPFSIFTGNYPEFVSPGVALLYYLSAINILLGLFNLIPAFPLDGGRVLRSVIWASNKNMTRSTVVAATIGRYFGWAFIAYGAFILISTRNLFGGIWWAFIGWFLASAADSSLREVTMRRALAGVLVKDVMSTNPTTVTLATPVESVVHDAFLACHCRAVPVVADGRPVGIITLDDVKKVGKDRWASTPAQEIMTREPLHTVSPEDDLNTVARLLAVRNVNQLPVVKNGELVGMVNRADIIRHLEVSQALGVEARRKT
jgi:Zn-dependent protease/CBS domain-containing protein